MTMNKVIRAWGGFVNGQLYVLPRKERPDEPVYDEPRYAIFPSKKEAGRSFEDVRRVSIVWEAP